MVTTTAKSDYFLLLWMCILTRMVRTEDGLTASASDRGATLRRRALSLTLRLRYTLSSSLTVDFVLVFEMCDPCL